MVASPAGGGEGFHDSVAFVEGLFQLRLQPVVVAARAFSTQLWGEVVDNEDVADANREGVLHDVSQLPNVARPRVVQHGLERILSDACDQSTAMLVELVNEVPRESFNVVLPVGKARQIERDDTDAVHQVLSEAAGFDELSEGLVCGGEDPDVDVYGRCSPQWNEGAFLQHSEQTRLNV